VGADQGAQEHGEHGDGQAQGRFHPHPAEQQGGHDEFEPGQGQGREVDEGVGQDEVAVDVGREVPGREDLLRCGGQEDEGQGDARGPGQGCRVHD
jgi:hypothetical protein